MSDQQKAELRQAIVDTYCDLSGGGLSKRDAARLQAELIRLRALAVKHGVKLG